MSARFALAVAAGLLNGAAFVYVGWLALIANVPLLLALRGVRSPWLATALGASVGFLAGLHIYGVLDYGQFILWGFAVYTGSQMVIYSLLQIGLAGRAGPWADVALPALVWTLSEWLRTLGSISLPASYVGCVADVAWLRPLLVLAPITGGIGVSSLVALTQSLLYHTLTDRRRCRGPLLAGAGLIGTVTLWGVAAPADLGGREVSVVAVQGGLPNSRYSAAMADPRAMRQVVHTYEVLTRRALESGADLVVWPETAVRAPVLERPELRARLLPRATDRGVLLAGLPVQTMRGERFNAAVAVAPGGEVLGAYHKVRLVPQHEDVYTPGTTHQPIDTPAGRIGVMICLESVYPAIGRAVTAAGAELLVVISNDAGFRRSNIARHMTNRAIVRAVENGRWLLRVGQAGITTLVDPRGRSHGALALFEPGLLAGRARLRADRTPYTRWGDWWIVLIGLGLAAVAAAGRRRRRRGTRRRAGR